MFDRQSVIGIRHDYPKAPVRGARPVYFKDEDGEFGAYWRHVGWLMPARDDDD